MTDKKWIKEYNFDSLKKEAKNLLPAIDSSSNLEVFRQQLLSRVAQIFYDMFQSQSTQPAAELIRSRDCAAAFQSVLSKRSDERTGFSVTQALWDIATGKSREDLKPDFFAELIQWIRGLERRAKFQYLGDIQPQAKLTGREAAIQRSQSLDRMWAAMELKMARFADGLSQEAQDRRKQRMQHILQHLDGTEEDWYNWRWHTKHIIRNADTLRRVVPVTNEEALAIKLACENCVPFGVTPYYASLMDEENAGRDQAIRAQVIPPIDYTKQMVSNRGKHEHSFDFMLEADTSPIDLITRRYPGIVILKPYNACPQICTYCQRNWEIDQPMAPGAFMGEEKIEAAIKWIENHPAIHEVLVTGGDPLMLSDEQLEKIMNRLARVPHVDLIRIGTRTPVTVPMRITKKLAEMLGGFREMGHRDVAVVTHIEHPYELTMETARAVDLFKRAGISVYNQQVYTFYVSRRFESSLLRMLLRRIGIDPYYTFVPKGKEETNMYRVPLARVLQEQKEEARLIPGLRRTDEAVYNVPGLGKNYIRARQHRDLLTVLPDGSRVYEFHPWEKNITTCETYLATDVSILGYLRRLQEVGENIEDYDSIWFYF